MYGLPLRLIERREGGVEARDQARLRAGRRGRGLAYEIHVRMVVAVESRKHRLLVRSAYLFPY